MREAPVVVVPSDRPSPRARVTAAQTARPPAARRKTKPPSILARAFARPGVTVAGAVFAAIMTGIVANAILFQKGRHPAPLFNPAPPVQAGAAAPLAQARRTAEAAPTPLPAAAPATTDAPPPVAAVPPVPRKAATASHKAAARLHPDPLGQLIAKDTAQRTTAKAKIAHGGATQTSPAHKAATAAIAAPPKKDVATAAVSPQR